MAFTTQSTGSMSDVSSMFGIRDSTAWVGLSQLLPTLKLQTEFTEKPKKTGPIKKNTSNVLKFKGLSI